MRRPSSRRRFSRRQQDSLFSHRHLQSLGRLLRVETLEDRRMLSVVTFDWATIGNPGNVGELSGAGAGGYGPNAIVGAVDYIYSISKHEVTTGQYTEFLNAVADSDPNELYNPNMWSSQYGCKIQRLGSSGTYIYSIAADRADRPVNYVSFFDAMRFTNWLENGQPTGDQGFGTTEDGTYTISDGLSEARDPNATFFIPSEDEWYKAAYHKNDGPTDNYWDYQTSSDNAPGYVNNSGDLSGTGTAFVEGGTDPGNYATYDGDYGTKGIGSPYWMTEVGEWENSESPYGTFDQGATSGSGMRRSFPIRIMACEAVVGTTEATTCKQRVAMSATA